MPDYAKMSDEELEAANQALQAERFAIGEEQGLLAAERDLRAAKAATTRLLEGLSPGELDVLVEAASAKLASAAPTPGEGEGE